MKIDMDNIIVNKEDLKQDEIYLLLIDTGYSKFFETGYYSNFDGGMFEVNEEFYRISKGEIKAVFALPDAEKAIELIGDGFKLK